MPSGRHEDVFSWRDSLFSTIHPHPYYQNSSVFLANSYSLIPPDSFRGHLWIFPHPCINPVESSLHCKKRLCLPSVSYHSQLLRCYCHIPVFDLIIQDILAFQRNETSLTGELSLLQRWSIVKSIISCLLKSTCKVSKSLSSQKKRQPKPPAVFSLSNFFPCNCQEITSSLWPPTTNQAPLSPSPLT